MHVPAIDPWPVLCYRPMLVRSQDKRLTAHDRAVSYNMEIMCLITERRGSGAHSSENRPVAFTREWFFNIKVANWAEGVRKEDDYRIATPMIKGDSDCVSFFRFLRRTTFTSYRVAHAFICPVLASCWCAFSSMSINDCEDGCSLSSPAPLGPPDSSALWQCH
ncbi:MAG: hypothetical protein LZF60_50128 [Nitrospira sp.]|nr:MAG: hypothetical protein LZF60_50128 [Nitrospira sp.]